MEASASQGLGGNPDQEQNQNPAEVPLTQNKFFEIIDKTVSSCVNQAVNKAIGGVKSILAGEIASQRSANEATVLEVEKLKSRKTSFRFKGNEEQVTFNNTTLEFLDQSIRLISQGSSISAKVILEKATAEVKQRNKLIKLADKSEAGWGAVDEYLADDLAEDSDDDKKIRAAQARALVAKKKKTSAKSGKKPYARRIPVASPPNPMASFATPSFGHQPNHSFRGYNSNRGRSGPRATDYCFACQKQGHWRQSCPNVAPTGKQN